MLKEGYDPKVIQDKIKKLPKLNLRNQLALSIYSYTENNLISIREAIELLNLNLTKNETYLLLIKINFIKNLLNELKNKELNKHLPWR